MDEMIDNVSPEVVEPESTEPAEVETTEPIEEKPKQSAEENARFAEQRRKQELDQLRAEKQRIEQERAEALRQVELLKNASSAYFDGETPEDIAFAAMANSRGVSIEQVKQEYEADRQRLAVESEKDAKIAAYEAWQQDMQRQKAEELYNSDLKAVQEIDPNVKDLEALGEDFVKLRFTINPLTGEQYSVSDVYNHIKSKIKPLPASSGKVDAAPAVEDKDYLTDDELSKISVNDYANNPKLREKARKTLFGK